MNALVYAVRSPWVAGAKAWLLAMYVFQGFGRASFSLVEFGLAWAALIALITVRLVRRPARSRFGSLEQFQSGAAPASCPLGFGCAPESRVAGSNELNATGVRTPYAAREDEPLWEKQGS